MPHRWCSSAILRKEQIESGMDLTFNDVFLPYYLSVTASLDSISILEVGAGTGHLSKELSNSGYAVSAIEPSLGMFEVAKLVLSGTNVNLRNCSSVELNQFANHDTVISHLVAHVVDDLNEFFASIGKHLTEAGHFVFSIPHPCFYNDYKHFFGDEYNYMVPMKKNVSFNITKDQNNSITGVPYHHRPLSDYINVLSQSGFSIKTFDEIYPSEAIQEKYGAKWQSPRYCVFQCVKL